MQTTRNSKREALTERLRVQQAEQQRQQSEQARQWAAQHNLDRVCWQQFSHVLGRHPVDWVEVRDWAEAGFARDWRPTTAVSPSEKPPTQ